MATRYLRPGWFTTNVFNRLVARLTRIGISVLGSRILAVRGRKTGLWRTTPVNLLTHDCLLYTSSKLTVIHEFESEDASYAEVASGWSLSLIHI